MKQEQQTKNETTVVRKGPILELVLFIGVAAVCILLGVLLLVKNSIGAVLPMAILIFSGAAVALIFAVQFIWFRVTVEHSSVTIRQIGKPTETYSYLDVSWRLRFPDNKKSALKLCVKGKPVASVHNRADNIAALAALRHSGKTAKGEKEFLQELGL